MNKAVKCKQKDKILLFIPGYNCEKQIPRVLDKIDEEIARYFDEIIFVNNRSTDNTEDIVLNYKPKSFMPRIKVLRNDHNYNLGGSHKVAFSYALNNGFDYVVVLHGDDQGDIRDLKPILKSGEYENYDAMLGARFMKGSKLGGYSKFRTFGNRVYNHLFSMVVHRKIYDLGSGLNIYDVRALESKYYHKFPDRLTFNYCMVMALDYYNQKVKFFPISWREEDQSSNVKLMSQAMNVLKMLGKYKRNHEFIKTELREKPIDEYTYQEIKRVKK
ncbi:glycosyltransferase family 2 protein [Candidatus Saccharibacteria bacterium]|nr:glycosyltransferase family 2 protein [Candidatus Saccharibacteria bacterium]